MQNPLTILRRNVQNPHSSIWRFGDFSLGVSAFFTWQLWGKSPPRSNPQAVLRYPLCGDTPQRPVIKACLHHVHDCFNPINNAISKDWASEFRKIAQDFVFIVYRRRFDLSPICGFIATFIAVFLILIIQSCTYSLKLDVITTKRKYQRVYF